MFSPGSERVVAILALLAALLLAVFFGWEFRDVPHFGVLQDDGFYFTGAKSLAEGSGYRIPNFPEEPNQTKYPPLYPALLSLAWKLQPSFPNNLSTAVILSWLWLPCFAFLGVVFFREIGLSSARSMLMGAAVLINPLAVFLSLNLMAELMFATMILSTLIVAHRAWKSHRDLLALGAGLLGAAAFLTKTAALSLLASVPLCFAFHRRYRSAGLFLAGMAPAVAAWNLWAHARASTATDDVSLYYTRYLEFHLRVVSWEDLPTIVATNLGALLRGIGRLVSFCPLSGYWLNFVMVVAALITIAGCARLRDRVGASQYHFFAVSYCLMLLLWHYPPNERFTLPLLPFLLVGFVTELSALSGMATTAIQSPGKLLLFTGHGVRIAIAAGIVGIFASGAKFLANDLSAILIADRRLAEERQEAYRWIETGTPETARFVAYQDTLIYLQTNRHAVRLHLPVTAFYRRDRETVFRRFREVDEFAKNRELEYVMWTSSDFSGSLSHAENQYARRILDAHRNLHLEHTTSNVRIYRVCAP